MELWRFRIYNKFFDQVQQDQNLFSMHNLSSKMISYAIIFVGICIIIFICACNYFVNIPLYFIPLKAKFISDQVSASRMLSSTTDYFTGENLRTIEGQIPLVSCPLGYHLI